MPLGLVSHGLAHITYRETRPGTRDRNHYKHSSTAHLTIRKFNRYRPSIACVRIEKLSGFSKHMLIKTGMRILEYLSEDKHTHKHRHTHAQTQTHTHAQTQTHTHTHKHTGECRVTYVEVQARDFNNNATREARQ